MASSVRALTPSMTRDARIGAQFPVQLAMTDIDGDDAARAALQQHVGESAGGGADVDGRAGPSRRSQTRRARAPA